MYVSRNKINILRERTSEKFAKEDFGKFIDPALIESYQKLLKSIADERKYNEGEKIMPSDLARITPAVNSLLDSFNSGLIEKRAEIRPTTRFSYDPFSATVAVTDYFHAMAMETLGCPDMPAQFGFAVTGHIESIAPDTELAMKQEEYNKITAENYYRSQRKKSAKEVAKKTRELKADILKKTASPLKIARYVAEYQALKKRQEGHGAIWRYFHKKENEERTALLESMEKTLASVFDKKSYLDSFTPAEIAGNYNKNLVYKLVRESYGANAIGKRFQIPSNLFHTEATSDERALNDKDAPDSKKQLIGEYRYQMEFEKNEFTTHQDGSEEIELSEKTIDEIPLSKSSRVNM